MEEIILKQVSNKTLLDMYYDYRRRNIINQEMLDRNTDKKVIEYYSYKKVRDAEYLAQIEREILSRMYGMEID